MSISSNFLYLTGVGKSSSGLYGWDYGVARSSVSSGSDLIKAGDAP